ncbi:MAG: 16S rRNA (cytosine(1402)-N(4))-methyltransferase RsmH [Planctomycetota bacterium]
MTRPTNPSPPDGTPQEAKPKRRPRYAGRYPRRFEERYKELDADAYPGMQEHVRAKGRTPAGAHVPVLLAEIMAFLKPAPGDTVVDCTVGYGGHAQEFLRRIGPAGRLIGLDVDAVHLDRARRRLGEGPVTLVESNFAAVDRVISSCGLDGCDALFADLGPSSMQLDDPARGFSYKRDGPLDMRLDPNLPRTASDLLMAMTTEELAAALTELADEPDARRIATRIAAARSLGPITTTSRLVGLVLEAKRITRAEWQKKARAEPGTLHPAALTFQALRMLVNDELPALEQLLRVAPACLRPAGRFGVTSFHSGEDRLVKRALREGLRAGIYAAVSDDPIRPSPEEIRSNPRSASGKFRWAIRATG